ncbi:MAG: YdeI/OmpD-associated family protein [Woeseiaceae bacterium]|nr:YdeI/OmpD-associated family protein [Woeseiaceae bacterium]
MGNLDNSRKLEFRSRREIRDWLKVNHATAEPFWIVTFKKHVSDRYIPYGEIVEELLCFGWVDSRTRRLDDDRTMLFVSPRKPGSTWSAPNKKRVAELTRKSLMTPAGQATIDSAKSDGSWTFLDEIENLVIPKDLAKQLNANRAAKKNFEAFNDSAKKVILLWLKTAKRADTRAKRVRETVRLAGKGIKAAHPEAKGQ